METFDRTWRAATVTQVETLLDTRPDGLSDDEARARLQEFGANELEEAPPPNPVLTFAGQFRSPLIYVLLGAGIVTATLREWIDAAAIALVLMINAIIGFTQERRAEASVRALGKLVSPQARVIRGGHERQLPSRELVPGDLALLETGVRVPADLRLIHVVGLRVDESLLTGESVPVTKQSEPVAASAELAERACMAHAGSVVTSGRAHGYVVSTGMGTVLGGIAGQIRAEKAPPSPLQVRMSRLARSIGVVVAVAAICTFGVGIAVGESVSDMFRFAVAMAVSAIPEGLPVVLTVTLAVGVRRMAERHAIVRRLSAIETLGSTTVIGSDKTGTLTENRMTVEEIWAASRTWHLDGDATARAVGDEAHPLHRTLLCGVLASEAQLYLEDGEVHTEGDPTEAALLVAAAGLGIEPEQVRDRYDSMLEVPFEPALRYSASVRADHTRHRLFVKGAPERIIELCDAQLGVGGPETHDAEATHIAAQAMANQGLRVLAMAERTFTAGRLGDPERIVEGGGLTFLGLQGMLDPPRAGVVEAVAGCRRAGIRPIMITGDHAITARAIATRVGIADEDSSVLTGSVLDDLDDTELREHVTRVAVFARVSPEHKLRIVESLRANGEVVALTGDGVNDAPALKAADIGIAMGKGGTDVAREAADMILADDNFTSIYAAVHLGRATFDNVRKVTFFLLSTGAAEIAALLIALALRWPLLLLPTQILWLNLVTNGVQDLALSFEPAESDILERPPRARREGVMSPLLWQRTLLVGAVMAAGMLVVFRWELDRTGSIEDARTMGLTTMVLFQAFHLGNVRSERTSAFKLSPLSNPFLLTTAAVAVAIQTGALYFPLTQYLLRVEPINLADWLLAIAVASTVIVAGEVHKRFTRLRAPPRARKPGSRATRAHRPRARFPRRRSVRCHARPGGTPNPPLTGCPVADGRLSMRPETEREGERWIWVEWVRAASVADRRVGRVASSSTSGCSSPRSHSPRGGRRTRSSIPRGPVARPTRCSRTLICAISSRTRSRRSRRPRSARTR